MQFDLKDEAAIAVCLSETYTWYGEDPVNFICFGLRYISTMDPPIRTKFTANLPKSAAYTYDSAQTSTPYYA